MDDKTPSVDLLQMSDTLSSVPPPPPPPEIPKQVLEQEMLAERRTEMVSPSSAADVSRVSGCYATCRACAEERYVRQHQQQQQRHNDVTTTAMTATGSTSFCRCPMQTKLPSLTVDNSSVASETGPVYFNYFRFASTTGNSNRTNDPQWSSVKATRGPAWLTKTSDSQIGTTISATLPRLGITGSGSTRCSYLADDIKDDIDDDVFDVRRRRLTSSSSKHSKRGYRSRRRLPQTVAMFDHVIETLSSMCCRRRTACCNRKSTAELVPKHNNRQQLVLMSSTNIDELTDTKMAATAFDKGERTRAKSANEMRWSGVPEITDDVGGQLCRSSLSGERQQSLKKKKKTRMRRRRKMMLAVGLMAGLFVIAASVMIAIVLMWSDKRRTTDFLQTGDESSSRIQQDDNIHVQLASSSSISSSSDQTSTQNIQYISVLPSLSKATTDSLGWAMFEGGSDKGSRYTLIDKTTTFYGAQERCQKLGGYLVHINSLREQLFLEDFITQHLDRLQDEPVTRHPGTGLLDDGTVGYWIGAKRQRGSHEGTCMYDQWKWVDSYGRTLSTISGITAFIPGTPDNIFSPEECLYISYKDRSDEAKFLKWDDAPCDLNSVGGIKVLCEVELR